MCFDGLVQVTFKIASVSKMSFLVVPKHRQLVAPREPWVQPRSITELRVQEQFLSHCTTYALGYLVRPNAKYSSR